MSHAKWIMLLLLTICAAFGLYAVGYSYRLSTQYSLITPYGTAYQMLKVASIDLQQSSQQPQATINAMVAIQEARIAIERLDAGLHLRYRASPTEALRQRLVDLRLLAEFAAKDALQPGAPTAGREQLQADLEKLIHLLPSPEASDWLQRLGRERFHK